MYISGTIIDDWDGKITFLNMCFTKERKNDMRVGT